MLQKSRVARYSLPASATISYILALAFIAMLALISHVLLQQIVAGQQFTASTVNFAGRQRMLAQRMTRFADEIADGSVDTRNGRQELERALTRMGDVETLLQTGSVRLHVEAPTSTALRNLYFGSKGGLSLQVHTFLEHGRSLLLKPVIGMDDADLAAMRVAVGGPLSNTLDLAVQQYQAEAEAETLHLRHLMTLLTGGMLVTLLLEALIIYRPLFHRLTYASCNDDLTGCLNRRELLLTTERSLARAVRDGEELSLIMADIDHFKQVNDTWGHAAGDQVIQQFVRVAESCLRRGDSIGRIGGEEFIILLPGADVNGALLVAERIRSRFAEAATLISPAMPAVHATVSLGVISSASARSLESMLSEADSLLYRAKASGRNCVAAVLKGMTAPSLVRN